MKKQKQFIACDRQNLDGSTDTIINQTVEDAAEQMNVTRAAISKSLRLGKWVAGGTLRFYWTTTRPAFMLPRDWPLVAEFHAGNRSARIVYPTTRAFINTWRCPLYSLQEAMEAGREYILGRNLSVTVSAHAVLEEPSLEEAAEQVFAFIRMLGCTRCDGILLTDLYKYGIIKSGFWGRDARLNLLARQRRIVADDRRLMVKLG